MDSSPTKAKLVVGLIFGGASGEHAISIRSACTVKQGFNEGSNPERYQVRCFYIDQKGRWWGEEVAEAVLKSQLPAPLDDQLEREASMASRPGHWRCNVGFRCSMAPMGKTAPSRVYLA